VNNLRIHFDRIIIIVLGKSRSWRQTGRDGSILVFFAFAFGISGGQTIDPGESFFKIRDMRVIAWGGE
jgi:hypothetical protein